MLIQGFWLVNARLLMTLGTAFYAIIFVVVLIALVNGLIIKCYYLVYQKAMFVFLSKFLYTFFIRLYRKMTQRQCLLKIYEIQLNY